MAMVLQLEPLSRAVALSAIIGLSISALGVFLYFRHFRKLRSQHLNDVEIRHPIQLEMLLRQDKNYVMDAT